MESYGEFQLIISMPVASSGDFLTYHIEKQAGSSHSIQDHFANTYVLSVGGYNQCTKVVVRIHFHKVRTVTTV